MPKSQRAPSPYGRTEPFALDDEAETRDVSREVFCEDGFLVVELKHTVQGFQLRSNNSLADVTRWRLMQFVAVIRTDTDVMGLSFCLVVFWPLCELLSCRVYRELHDVEMSHMIRFFTYVVCCLSLSLLLKQWVNRSREVFDWSAFSHVWTKRG